MARILQERTVDEDGDMMEDRRVTERRMDLSPARILGGIAGIVYAVVGVIGVTDAGIDGSWNDPVVEVAGLDMGAGVALGFLVLGLALLLAAATGATRGAIGAMGALSLVAGVLGAAVSDQIRADVGFGTDTAWFAVIVGAILLGAAMIASTRVEQRRQEL